MIEEQSPYALIGGEEGLKKLVQQFYVNVESCPEAAELRAMHQKDMTMVAEKLFEYLSSWLGGPNLYQKKYGSMCIVKPHAPFSIGIDARDQWLFCFFKTLDDLDTTDEVREMLREPIQRVADFLRNQKD